MSKRAFPLSGVHALLEPGPVVLLSSAAGGRANVMAQSWHTLLEFEPPLVACVISSRNHSFAAIDASGECVINLPGAALADAIVGCGNTSGATLDKFAAFGLSPEPARLVAPPLIRECFASLECRLADRSLVARYGLFIFEVVAAWHDPALPHEPTLHHRSHGEFMLSGPAITLPSRAR